MVVPALEPGPPLRIGGDLRGQTDGDNRPGRGREEVGAAGRLRLRHVQGDLHGLDRLRAGGVLVAFVPVLAHPGTQEGMRRGERIGHIH